MSWKDYCNREVLDIFSELNSDPDRGLDSTAAKERLAQVGSNRLAYKSISWFDILLRQFASSFIYMLVAAAALAFVLRQNLEGAMILVFLLINAVLGFFQEYRSEKTAGLLSELIAWQTKVIRGGKTKIILAADLVPGDIMVLEAGDKVSADARIIEADGLSTDEASLTGESLPVAKQSERLLAAASELQQAANIIFSGTDILSGRAKAVVIATGRQSVIGRIANLSAKTKKLGSFAGSIAGLSNFILKLVIVTLIFVFILNLFIKGAEANWIELMIFSIALAIGVIPEALPLVMTFSFSKGAMVLAKNKIVIKRLSSIEDLGNIEILCSDKTGTLTEGKLSVFEVYAQNKTEEEVLENAIMASGELSARRDPFDLALKKSAGRKISGHFKDTKFLFGSPFDPKFLRNNALIQVGENIDLIVRGAPEVVLGLCAGFSRADSCAAADWAAEQGRLGRRVLAVARRRFKDINLDDFKNNFRAEEKDLEFLGLISFADKIKASALQAVKQARNLGVRIKIISGDSREVAGAVAYQIGLISDPSEVLSAAELDLMSPDEAEAAILKYDVFARIPPDKKYEIIKSLQENHSVGYLGDGINDAPALKVAGVSLAVNNSADIAREAADVILLESNLKVIIQGIKEGRKIFINGAKYIKATLASNFGNFYAVAIASLLVPFLPMLPLQILLLNLLSDFPMIAIATDNIDKGELAAPKKYQTRDILAIAMILGVLSTIFDFVFFALFKNISPSVLQTNWFIASILTELAFLFSIRTKGFMFSARRPSRLVFLLTGVAVVVTMIIPFTAFGAEIFNFTPPLFKHLVWIFSLAGFYLVCSEAIKLIYYRNKKLGSDG